MNVENKEKRTRLRYDDETENVEILYCYDDDYENPRNLGFVTKTGIEFDNSQGWYVAHDMEQAGKLADVSADAMIYFVDKRLCDITRTLDPEADLPKGNGTGRMSIKCREIKGVNLQEKFLKAIDDILQTDYADLYQKLIQLKEAERGEER